ncbi:hypothetical protein [Nitrobacter hamburgensis]|nr:hypothetical protein [Nitrobacter hamburgensis]
MSVSWTDWKTDDKDGEFAGPAKQDIRRTYSFPNIDSAGGIATLTIVCVLEMTMLPDGENVSLDRKLRFYLRPFRLQHEANFIMGFMTRAESHGGEFDVLAAPSGDEDGMAIIAKYGGRNDVSACIATLRAGRDLVFSLQDEQESLVNFLLPNDDTFQRLYDETIQTLQQRAVLNQILMVWNGPSKRHRRCLSW